MADWWAKHNLDAPEVEQYRPYLREPVLDAGCGTGRLLGPWHDEGIDIDGCDASVDMIARCAERAPCALLWVSALHELDPPRQYGTIVACGVFGLGSTREQDEQAIRRLHDALLPGGALVLDNEEKPFTWRVRDWGEPDTDGEISLWSRVDAVEQDDRCVHLTIRAESTNGRCEEHHLTMRQWYAGQIVALLERNGFTDVCIRPGVDEHFVVYLASRDGDLQPLRR
jgi:SAM-dependent methyltransferase